jgi:hypothetical protein
MTDEQNKYWDHIVRLGSPDSGQVAFVITVAVQQGTTLGELMPGIEQMVDGMLASTVLEGNWEEEIAF